MTSANLDTSNIMQQFFTKQSDSKKSSLIELSPRMSFNTEDGIQSDIYLIDGNISVEREIYERGTYISTAKSVEFAANACGAKFFLYQEPIVVTGIETTVKPTDQIWRDSGIEGMKNAVLRTSGHHVLLVSWEPETKVPFHIHPNGEEIFVLNGELFDRETSLKCEEWIRMMPNSGHSPSTKEKTLILLRNGHL